jgi:hypothetical protein
MHLIASGRYVYETNGIERAVEPWRIFRTEDDYRVTVAERSAPEMKTHLEVVHREGPEGLETISLTFRESPQSEVLAHGDYRLERGLCRFKGQNDQGWSDTPLARAHFFPLMRVFTGAMVTALVNAGGEGEVIVPHIAHPEPEKPIFQPTRSQRLVERMDGLAPIYLYRGGPYEKPATILLNNEGMMERYCWEQSDVETWVCRLEKD